MSKCAEDEGAKLAAPAARVKVALAFCGNSNHPANSPRALPPSRPRPPRPPFRSPRPRPQRVRRHAPAMPSSADSPAPQRPSLRDIGRAVGLSHVAVSLALRDSPRISEEKRKLVREAAERLGYRPDPMLASLVAYRRGKQAIGIRSALGWINQWQDPKALRRFKEFDGYWNGARDAAERLGYHLEEFCWERGRSGTRLQTILETRGVRGLLIPPHGGKLDLPDFDWSRFSLVRFGVSVTNLAVHTVTSDQSHCGRLAYERARQYGYHRVGYMSDADFERSTCGHFREGYLNAQDEIAPQDFRLSTLVLGRDTARDEAEVKAWLAREKPDAAIVTERRIQAVLERVGVKVPKDLAVVALSVLDGGYDAGTDQNPYEIGRVAVSTLASLILENERGLPRYQRRILVEGRWVDGKSLPPRGD